MWRILTLLLIGPVLALAASTTVTDIVYLADDSLAPGYIVISWPRFTTSTGTVIGAGSKTVTLSSGAFSTPLQPSTTATPTFTYAVEYHITGQSVSTETWAVPVSGTPVTIQAIVQ